MLESQSPLLNSNFIVTPDKKTLGYASLCEQFLRPELEIESALGHSTQDPESTDKTWTISLSRTSPAKSEVQSPGRDRDATSAIHDLEWPNSSEPDEECDLAGSTKSRSENAVSWLWCGIFGSPAQSKLRGDGIRPFSLAEGLDTFFSISLRGSNIKTEVRAGVVLFATCAYIIVLNADVLQLGGFNPYHVAMGTIVTAMVSTALFGVIANVPCCGAPGMGINGMIAFELIKQHGLTPAQSLACCLVAGGLFLIVGASGLGPSVITRLPRSIKLALVSGIGLLQASIGLSLLDVLKADPFSSASFHSSLISLRPYSQIFGSPQIYIFLFSVIFLVALVSLEVPGGILVGIVVSSCVSYLAAPHETPPLNLHFSDMKSFDLFGVDVSVFRKHRFASFASLLLFGIILIDSGGVLTGLTYQLDEDHADRKKKEAERSAIGRDDASSRSNSLPKGEPIRPWITSEDIVSPSSGTSPVVCVKCLSSSLAPASNQPFLSASRDSYRYASCVPGLSPSSGQQLGISSRGLHFDLSPLALGGEYGSLRAKPPRFSFDASPGNGTIGKKPTVGISQCAGPDAEFLTLPLGTQPQDSESRQDECPRDVSGLMDSFRCPTKIYAVLGASVILSAIVGTSPPLIMLESAVAIRSGGRTGLTAVVCAALFMIPYACFPIVSLVTPATAASILMFIGSLMVGALTEIHWSDPCEAVPAFVTLSLIPMTSSITNGVIMGLALHLIMNGPRHLLNWVRDRLHVRQGVS